MGRNFDVAVRAFSDAVVGAQSWQLSLDEICDVLGASGATIVPLKGRLSQLPTSSSFGEAIDSYVKQGWHQQDVRFQALGALRERGVATDFDFISEAEMTRSPYYQDWLRPFGFKWFSAVHINSVGEEWVLSLQRSGDREPFDAEECRRFVNVSKSLSASAGLGHALGFARADAAMGAFNLSKKAVIMLDRHGEVVRMNEAAEALLDDDLFIRGRRLRCMDPASAKKLDHAIWKAVEYPHLNVEGPVLLSRKDAGPLLVEIAPAHGAVMDIFSSTRVYLVLSDPFTRKMVSKSVLQSMFSLTKAEAEIALRLSSGARLRDVADLLGISYETARSHLRKVYEKTKVNTQADLIAIAIQIGS